MNRLSNWIAPSVSAQYHRNSTQSHCSGIPFVLPPKTARPAFGTYEHSQRLQLTLLTCAPRTCVMQVNFALMSMGRHLILSCSKRYIRLAPAHLIRQDTPINRLTNATS